MAAILQLQPKEVFSRTVILPPRLRLMWASLSYSMASRRPTSLKAVPKLPDTVS
jgi:hypothetical protein